MLNDIKDANTEVNTRDMAIVGYKMLDKVTAEPKTGMKERLDTHLRTEPEGLTDWWDNRADPGMESPDSLLTHE